MGEKWTPHTRLHIVKTMGASRKGSYDDKCLQWGGSARVQSRIEMYDAVLALTPSDFYKSMTADKDPGYWQEVYRLVYNGQSIYLKLIVKDNVVIVSFKEL